METPRVSILFGEPNNVDDPYIGMTRSKLKKQSSRKMNMKKPIARFFGRCSSSKRPRGALAAAAAAASSFACESLSL
eukprot:4380248-Pyramimonas_sp.AAC.1